jgi:GT2 family glycosyltransferase
MPSLKSTCLPTSQQKLWPKVTVIIVSWNGAPFLERCLSDLLAQTVLPQEIIVVDNASSDTSCEIVRRFPSVRLLAQSENLGFARGNNLAIESAAADTEWIASLNPDAFADPFWLETLLLATRNYPDFDMFGCKQISSDELKTMDGMGDVYHLSGLGWRKGHGLPVSSISEQSKEIFSPCAAAALYRLAALSEVGGFDEDYFCYSEDVDLGFRLRLAGYKARYVPGAVVYHVGSATTGGQHSDFSVYHGHRNLVWTYVKNMPGPLFWLLLPLHLLLNLITIIVFTLRGQFRVIMHAKLDAIKGLLLVLAKRKKIQRALKANIRDIWQALDRHLIPNKKI